MCGISGYFSSAPLRAPAERRRLERMRDALAHRGPDGNGIRVFPHAALVHNRLAIIDLKTGHQPLSSTTGHTHLVFNGEIYNFRELRTALEGYPFRTRSDTEVILALYEAEGPAGWTKLGGMYAFALWDERLRKGYLVRDPMGIKPLFYTEIGGQLVFGSEAKALFAHGLRPEIDLAALHQVMNFRYVPGDGSLFRGVRQLAPGTVLVWTRERTSSSVLLHAQDSQADEKNATSRDSVAALGDIFEQAVDRHLVSDVPVGCFLSGGIDSALIARIASQRAAITSYTLEVGDDPDEADNAAMTAEWLGIVNHRQSFAIPDVCMTHKQLLRHLETPKVNALQGMLLAEFAAQHVKVSLSGLGGDELFYGYNAHRILWLAGRAKRFLPADSNRMLARFLRPFFDHRDWTERIRALQMLAAMPAWSRVYGLLRNVWDAPDLRRRLYGERLLDADLPDSFDWLARHFPSNNDPVEAMAKFELRNKIINDLLWHEDRISMRVGLETRVPFLDQAMIRYARGLPRSDLMPWGRKKHALKRYAARVLPRTILRRRKSGFQLDIVSAAQHALKPLFDEFLSLERLRHHRLFNPRFVTEVRLATASKDLRWHWFLLYLMAQTHILMEELHAD